LLPPLKSISHLIYRHFLFEPAEDKSDISVTMNFKFGNIWIEIMAGEFLRQQKSVVKPRHVSISAIIILCLLFSASAVFSEDASTAHFIAPVAICLPTCEARFRGLLLGNPQGVPINNSMGWTAFSNLSPPDLGPNGDVVRFIRGEKQPPPVCDTCVTVNNKVGIALQKFKDVFVSTQLFKDDKVFNDNGTVRSWRVLLPVLDRSCNSPCAGPSNCACPQGGHSGIAGRFHVAECANVLITDIVTEGDHEGIVVGGIECFNCDNYYARDEVTPASHNFGPVNVGASSTPVTFTISNTGRADLMIDSMDLTDTATGLSSKEFNRQSDNCTGHLIAPSSNCKLQAVFSPTSAGPKNAILSISSNSSHSPHNVSLTGIGITTMYSLSVGDISGDGSVSAMGIDCPPDCSESYHSGTDVAVKAKPGAGWYFDSWGGDILGNMNPYGLLINSNKHITVTFRKIAAGATGNANHGLFTVDHGTLVYNLIAGGRHPIYVGSVSVSDDSRNLTVTYASFTGDWIFAETHLHVATSVGDIPTGKNGCMDPGRFAHSAQPASLYTSQTYTIPISSIFGYRPAPGGPYTIYIAAEATVRQGNDKGSKQTAWGEDRSFPCRKWSSYISYPLNISP
jgi:hypothetical protein